MEKEVAFRRIFFKQWSSKYVSKLRKGCQDRRKEIEDTGKRIIDGLSYFFL